MKTITIFFSEISHIAMRCRRVEFSAAQLFAVGGLEMNYSLIYITLPICVGVRVRVTEDAQNNRVLGMGMPRTRGCPYHCDTGIT